MVQGVRIHPSEIDSGICFGLHSATTKGAKMKCPV